MKRRKKAAVGKRFSATYKPYPTYALTDDKYLNDAEYALLLKNLDALQGLKKTARNVALIQTAITTGARANEILNIRAKDLLSGNRVHIRGLKNSNDRSIPVPARVFESLQALAKELKPEDFIFSLSYRRFWEIWHEVNPTTKKLHATRHTFAMRLYMRTKDLFLVQRALGHKSINCTLIYLNFAQTQESMLKVVDESF